MRSIAEAGHRRDLGEGIARLPHEILCIIQSHPDVGVARGQLQSGKKSLFQTAATDFEAFGYRIDRQGMFHIFLHQQKCAFDHLIIGGKTYGDAGLGFFSGLKFVDDHDIEALASLTGTNMFVDQMRRQMCSADAARTGEAISINDENLIADRIKAAELLKEIISVKPTDAAFPPFHQAKAMQRKSACA